VPQSTQAEMEQAVESCKAAYRTWSKTTPLARQQIMFK
jgi:malonate-semialdehyde dehydrogenase (acetylating)/methylmalonate-semialdehyde dehydrogenase